MVKTLRNTYISLGLLAVGLMPGAAFAGTAGTVDSLGSAFPTGQSHAEDVSIVTNLTATGIDLAEDWVFPAGAVIIMCISLWRMWSSRDFMSLGLGVLASVGMLAIGPVITSIQAMGGAGVP